MQTEEKKKKKKTIVCYITANAFPCHHKCPCHACHCSHTTSLTTNTTTQDSSIMLMNQIVKP